MVELSLYESTAKLYASLAYRRIAPFSEAWNRAIEDVLERQRAAMAPRLWPEIPKSKYICFYPMDRSVPSRQLVPGVHVRPAAHDAGPWDDRAALRRSVRQIISGSIGFDDWEWGVDLFADDAVVFKRLIYEMRFDEASAIYALFGSFFIGIRRPAADLAALLA